MPLRMTRISFWYHPWPVLHVRVVAEEVQVVEEQPLDAAVVQQLLAARPDRGEVVLVHGLVGLDVEAPVSGAGVERDVRQVRVDRLPARVVPHGVHDAHARVVDRRHEPARVVVRVARRDRHHQLVHHGEDGQQRLAQRVVELDRVAREGESGDAHVAAGRAGVAYAKARMRAALPPLTPARPSSSRSSRSRLCFIFERLPIMCG